jgi:hypothetical protein
MKTFLAIYTGTTTARERSGWDTLSDADRAKREQEGMKAWMAWGEKHKAAIVENGAPLGKTKRIGAGGISDIRNAMAAYTVVQAESHEAAAKLFENHPHFTIFPGDSVEIMECLPIPGM